MMHLIIHMLNTSVIPFISLDQYLNPNLYTIPNMQNTRFFCCSVYIMEIIYDNLLFRKWWLCNSLLDMRKIFAEKNHQNFSLKLYIVTLGSF